jgi:hypothetical protein
MTLDEYELGLELCDASDIARPESPLPFVRIKSQWREMPHDKQINDLAENMFETFYHDGTSEQINTFIAARNKFRKYLHEKGAP